MKIGGFCIQKHNVVKWFLKHQYDIGVKHWDLKPSNLYRSATGAARASGQAKTTITQQRAAAAAAVFFFAKSR